MATDDFTISVTNAVLTDLAQGRPWQVGGYISRMGVYAPAAATNAEYGLIADDSEIYPRGTQPVGTAPSASPALEHKKVDITAAGQWRLPLLHAGAAAQTIRVQVEYEKVISTEVEVLE